MLNPIQYLSVRLIQSGTKLEVINYLLSQPLESKIKVRILKGWAAFRRHSLTRDELAMVEQSGIDILRGSR